MENKKKYEIVCTGLNEYGLGEFRIGKDIYSISNLLPKEKAIVEANDYQGIKKFKLVKLIKESNLRSSVPCKVFGRCGNCNLLHMAYEDQIKLKYNYVQKAFNDNKLKIKIDDVFKASNLTEYRNKMQVAYRYYNKDLIYGFYEDDTHRVIPFDNCLAHTKEQNEIAKAVLKIMKELKLTPYDEDKRTGLIRFLIVRYAYRTKETLVTIVTNGKIFPARSEFVKRLRNSCPYITTIVQNINTRKTSIILGDEEEVLYGKGYIEDILLGVKFNISSSTFYQVNSYQVEVLYNTVKNYLDLKGTETVIDAYCGVGTIGMILASQAKEVIGVEQNKKSVLNARDNAYHNKIKNIHFVIDDATNYLEERAKVNDKVDVLVMDPPRSGSTEVFLESVNKLAPNKVIYVSCEAKTLARDLKILLKNYKVTRCGIVDMFVNSYHVETVCLLTKK